MLIHSESRHPKTGIDIFVIIIPKEGLAGLVPAKLSFGLNCFKVCVCMMWLIHNYMVDCIQI